MSIGEAIGFGVDSHGTAFVIQSSVILAFYTIGFLTFGYLAMFKVENTKYFQEEEVTIPEHVKQEHARELELDDAQDSEKARTEASQTT